MVSSILCHNIEFNSSLFIVMFSDVSPNQIEKDTYINQTLISETQNFIFKKNPQKLGYFAINARPHLFCFVLFLHV